MTQRAHPEPVLADRCRVPAAGHERADLTGGGGGGLGVGESGTGQDDRPGPLAVQGVQMAKLQFRVRQGRGNRDDQPDVVAAADITPAAIAAA